MAVGLELLTISFIYLFGVAQLLQELGYGLDGPCFEFR